MGGFGAYRGGLFPLGAPPSRWSEEETEECGVRGRDMVGRAVWHQQGGPGIPKVGGGGVLVAVCFRRWGIPVQGSAELDTTVRVSCSVPECSMVGNVCAPIGQSRRFVLERTAGQHPWGQQICSGANFEVG